MPKSTMSAVEYTQWALEQRKWKIIEWMLGDEYDISGKARIRSPARQEFILLFHGMYDEGVLPLEQSYAVSLEGCPQLNEYISGKKVPREQRIDKFADLLTQFAATQ